MVVLLLCRKDGRTTSGSSNVPPSEFFGSKKPASPSSTSPEQQEVAAVGKISSGSDPQQIPEYSSLTKGAQATTAGKPEGTSTDQRESSGTNDSGSGIVTRNKAATKGKEVKDVKEAEDPEPKARRLRALACQKKEKNQQDASKTKEQDEKKVESSNTPQPKSSITISQPKSLVTTPQTKSLVTTPQPKSPVTTPKPKPVVTTPKKSLAVKPSASPPSDLSKSDLSDQNTATPVKVQEGPTEVSQLLPISDCWNKRPACLMKQFSLIEIMSTVVLLATVIVDLLESSMLLTQLHFKLHTGAHLLLMEC